VQAVPIAEVAGLALRTHHRLSGAKGSIVAPAVILQGGGRLEAEHAALHEALAAFWHLVWSLGRLPFGSRSPRVLGSIGTSPDGGAASQ